MLMLSATQIYTIFTVQLFAFLNLLPVEADIAAVSGFVEPRHEYKSGHLMPPVSVATWVSKNDNFVSLFTFLCVLFLDTQSWFI